MDFSFRTPGLRTLVAAALLIAGLVPLAAVLCLYLFAIEPRLQRQTLQEQEHLSLQMGAVLNRNLFERYGDVQAFALNSAARDPTAWRTPGAGPLVSAMDGYVELYDVYRLTMLVSPTGEVLAVNTRDAQGRPLETAPLYGRNMADERWFTDTLAGRFLEGDGLRGATVGPPQRAGFVGRLYGDEGHVLPFAARVYAPDGRLIGVWANFFDFRHVDAIARDLIQQRRQVVRSGQRFQVIAPDGALIFDSGEATPHQVEPAIRDFAMRRRPGGAAVSGLVDGEAVAAASAPSVDGFPGLGWTVVTREDASDAFGAVREIRNTVIAALALTTLVMLGFGAWLGRRLSEPILRLAERMRALAAGDADGPVPPIAQPDLGEMARAVEVFRKAVADKDLAAAQLAASKAETERERQRLYDVIDGVGDGFYALDREWRYTLLNAVAERHAGVGRHGSARTIWELFPNVIGTEVERRLRRVMDTRTPEAFEAPSVVRPGRFMESRVFPTPEGLGVWFRDVTERKQAEAALRESEDRRVLAMEAADIGAWDYDPVTGKVFWDDRCRVLFGFPPGDQVEYDAAVAQMHPDDRDRVQGLIRQALDPTGPGRYEAEYRVVDARTGEERWVAALGKPRFEEGRAVRLIGAVLEITERKRAELHRELLVNELNHRVKNALATVQALAQQTLKAEADPAEARASFTARVVALARAHDVLTLHNWESADLDEVIRNALKPYGGADAGRIRLDGPKVRLSPKAALAVSMAVFELGANAVKHGALSRDEGTVEVVWRIEDGRLRLTWRERGGPAVVPPGRRGFGSRLIEQGLAGELGARTSLAFEPSGVVCTIDAPLSVLGGEAP